MDFRQFQNQSGVQQPFDNQLNQQDFIASNRRPSISSMSSASGYASSSYGGNNQDRNNNQNSVVTPSTAAMVPNTTGNSLLSLRVSQSRHFGGNGTSTPNTPMQQHQLPPGLNLPQQSGNPNQQAGNSNGFNPSWLPQQTNPMMNVTPWIEQQAQVSPNINMSNLKMSSMNNDYQPQENYQTPTQSQPESLSQDPPSTATNLSMLTNSKSIPMQNNSSTVQSINGSMATINAPQPRGFNPSDDQSQQQDPAQQQQQQPQQDDNDGADNEPQSPIMSTRGDDDDVIPTAIVIKNIPFAIKKEQLLDVMTKLSLPLPYAFNYHFDNGVFRGLAFANFNSTDETSMVVNTLNGREIGGRKLRVEYKKMLPVQERERIEREKREKRGQLEEQHRSNSATSLASLYSIGSAPPTSASTMAMNNVNNAPMVVNQGSISSKILSDRLYLTMTPANQLPMPPLGVDFNDPETLDIYSKFVVFKDDFKAPNHELAYAISTLTTNQKRIISCICQFLNLFEGFDNGFVIIKKPESLIQQDNTGGTSMAGNAAPSMTPMSTGPSTSQQQQQALPTPSASGFPPTLIRSHSHNFLNNASPLNIGSGRYRQQSPRIINQPGQFGSNQPSSQSQQPMLHSSLSSSNIFQQSPIQSSSQSQQPQQPNSSGPGLHHTSSTVSLNLLRTNGLSTPTGGPTSATTSQSGVGLLSHGNLNAMNLSLNLQPQSNNSRNVFSSSGSQQQQQHQPPPGYGSLSGFYDPSKSNMSGGFNHPQLTGDSNISSPKNTNPHSGQQLHQVQGSSKIDDVFQGLENLSFN